MRSVTLLYEVLALTKPHLLTSVEWYLDPYIRSISAYGVAIEGHSFRVFTREFDILQKPVKIESLGDGAAILNDIRERYSLIPPALREASPTRELAHILKYVSVARSSRSEEPELLYAHKSSSPLETFFTSSLWETVTHLFIGEMKRSPHPRKKVCACALWAIFSRMYLLVRCSEKYGNELPEENRDLTEMIRDASPKIAQLQVLVGENILHGTNLVRAQGVETTLQRISVYIHSSSPSGTFEEGLWCVFIANDTAGDVHHTPGYEKASVLVNMYGYINVNLAILKSLTPGNEVKEYLRECFDEVTENTDPREIFLLNVLRYALGLKE